MNPLTCLLGPMTDAMIYCVTLLQLSPIISIVKLCVTLEYSLEVSWPQAPKDIPEPNHGKFFCGNFLAVYVLEGV